VDEIADRTAALGFEGVDLLVRKGHAVDPERPEGVTAASRAFAQRRLTLKMVTTDLVDPDPGAGRLLEACAAAGARLVRIGFYHYTPELGYTRCLEDARRRLAGLAALAERSGLKLLVQLHHGTIHSSGALTAALLRGLESGVGTYLDPGNQVKEGWEDWRLTLDLIGEGLACVGVKNAGWVPAGNGEAGQRVWQARWVPVREGLAPWPDILGHLARSRYRGLLSFHAPYEGQLAQVLAQAADDLAFARGLLGAPTVEPVS